MVQLRIMLLNPEPRSLWSTPFDHPSNHSTAAYRLSRLTRQWQVRRYARRSLRTSAHACTTSIRYPENWVASPGFMTPGHSSSGVRNSN